jgi:hypothetical protein
MVEDGFSLVAMDKHAFPTSEATVVTPLDEDEEAPSDFVWLAALCREAGQDEVLSWLRALYGQGRCPLCGASFTVMDAMNKLRG